MELIDNITRLLGDDLKATLKPKARLKVAASCFSMYAFEALKAEMEKIDPELAKSDFIFPSEAFLKDNLVESFRALDPQEDADYSAMWAKVVGN